MAVVACALPLAAQEARVPVVLSTDVGNEVDDQWTIVYLLTHPRFDVRGIMSAHAPSIRPPAGRTAYRILQNVVEDRLGMTAHPPLWEGASEPLADVRTPRPSEAVDFLLRASQGFSPENRLTVLTIGAATDVASVILRDPTITQRIRVVQMGYRGWEEGGQEFNIENDPAAAQVLLHSDVPLVVGAGDVCRRDLALSLDAARTLVAERGPVGRWLWEEFDAWYWRHVKPLRKNDFSKPWIIWDNVVLAYVLGMTTQEERPRPRMAEGFAFQPGGGKGTITWITKIDGPRMWVDFTEKLDAYQRTHRVGAGGE